MRVALFINTLHKGGAERLVKDLAVELEQVPGIVPVIIVAKKEGALSSAFDNRDMEVHSLNVHVSPASVPRAFQKFSRIVKKFEIDLVHSHLPFAHVISRSACALLGIPHVSTYHNVSQHKRLPKRILECSTERLSERTICVSEGVRQSYPKNKNMEVVYNALDVNGFYSDVITANISHLESQFSDDKLILLNVARCVEQKRQKDIIESMVMLKDTDIHLIIVGDGPKRELLESQVVKKGLEDMVTITGFVESIEPYFAFADVFISASENEGLPTTHIEAMAAKLPIISTDIPGVSEVVEPGETGYLCPVDSPSELAENILNMRNANLTKLGEKGHQRAKNKFSIQKITEQHVDIYESLV